MRQRHWKQHWDPNADLIFRKRLRMGDKPEKPFCLPGEPVTKEQREKLGPARLRRWFENGTLELANFTPPEPQRELALQKQRDDELESQKLKVEADELESQKQKDKDELKRVNADRLTKKLEDDGLVTRDDLNPFIDEPRE